MMNCSIRKLSERDITEGLELAYKAAYEYGFVNTEFDKTSFNFKVKNVFVQPNSESFGLFFNNQLIGFVVLGYDFLPWNDHQRMIINFLHIAPDYRNLESYQYVLNHCKAHARSRDIQTIRVTASDFVLNGLDKDTLLHSNRFMAADIIWERKLND